MDNNNLTNDFTLDLNDELAALYNAIDKKDCIADLKKEKELKKIRNRNHKLYYSIDILDIEDLPSNLDDYVSNIKKLYSTIKSKIILEESLEDAKNTKKLLDKILFYKNILDDKVLRELNFITGYNELDKSKYNSQYLNNLKTDIITKEKVINRYNDIILLDSNIESNSYRDLKNQIKIKNKFDEIKTLLNEKHKIMKFKTDNDLDSINKQIQNRINVINNKIIYLQDIINDDSIYTNVFNRFKDDYYRLISYDDKNIDDSKEVLKNLNNKEIIDFKIKKFEDLFIDEVCNKPKKEIVKYEKVALDNILLTLEYIKNNYTGDEYISKEIDEIYKNINDNRDIKEIETKLTTVISYIWTNSITKVYNYNENDNFMFICTNIQFIDERYEAILITKKELEKVQDYYDYQIGFICEYNKNILYATNKEDIMDIDYSDFTYLKTPKQIEDNFINLKICERIILDGYNTKIAGVYYINDGTIGIYDKALKLANSYKVPLIELKKDKN